MEIEVWMTHACQVGKHENCYHINSCACPVCIKADRHRLVPKEAIQSSPPKRLREIKAT